MFFARQRRELAELERQVAEDRRRVDRAKARFARARHAFLGNPLNLLLPFTAGALGGALALYRKPPHAAHDGARRSAADGVSLRSLVATAGTLWGATATLRESLRAARLEPPAPAGPLPGETASDAGMPPPAAIDDARQSAP